MALRRFRHQARLKSLREDVTKFALDIAGPDVLTMVPIILSEGADVMSIKQRIIRAIERGTVDIRPSRTLLP